MLNINTVTVIGATGTMGSNVAGIFASFGDAKVYCVGRNPEKVERTIPKIVKSVRADSIASNLIPAGIDDLESCVEASDLVFESVPERIEEKATIAKRIGRSLKDDGISCTGTSGLSINEIALEYPERLRGRFFGTHLFNPPYNMPLCELIPTSATDEGLKSQLTDYLRKKLLRTVVEVADTPAFLGNRIGFQFINNALRQAETYKDNGGIDYVDAILGPFTGRAMAPLVTSDFVGLDIHAAIVDNVYHNTNDFARKSFLLPEYVRNLVKEGKLGRKTNGGLYKLIRRGDGSKRMMVFDVASREYREAIPYVFPFAEKMKALISEGDYAEAFNVLVRNHSQEAQICLSFLLEYIAYCLYTADEVASGPQAADDVMATGFNWCPPLAMLGALSSVADVPRLIEERLPKINDAIDVERLVSSAVQSSYDYRPYFRTGR